MLFSRAMLLSPILAFLLLGSSCDGDRRNPDSAGGVRIGILYPFSGALSDTGLDLKAGVDLALDIVNRSHDLPIPLAGPEGLPAHRGLKMIPVYRDTRNDPDHAADMVEELVRREKVQAILGCYSSTVTSAASERAEMLRVPFLNSESTSPTLTMRGLKWFFRTTPHDEMFVQNFFTFLSDLEEREKIQIPRKLILVYENRIWGTSVAHAERKLATRYDYDVALEVPYDAGKTDVEEELSQIEHILPSIVLHASYSADAIRLVRGYKRRQMNPVAILAMDAGFTSPEFVSELGPDSEHVFSREVWALDIGSSKPLVTQVNELFKSRNRRNMTGSSAGAFTALMTLADALNRAASLEPDAIRLALLATHIRGDHLIMPWYGVKFDPATGQNMLGRGIIVQMQKGEYVTVWPWHLASRPPVWPAPPWSNRKDSR